MPDLKSSVKVLGVIAARGGSKGLPRKNILPVGGKPLIAWTIEAARASSALTRVILSTDDREIADVARGHGCEVPFMRPPNLATDTAKIEDVVLHALDSLNEAFDYVILLQPTSPLRIGADIDGAMTRCLEAGAPACVAVTEPAKSPYWMFRLDEAGRLCALFERPKGRRQDLPPTYLPNGAAYVARVDWFREHVTFYDPQTVACIMPPERSLDVDTAWDLLLVTNMVEGRPA